MKKKTDVVGKKKKTMPRKCGTIPSVRKYKKSFSSIPTNTYNKLLKYLLYISW